tara:strand:+ start:6136 stop:7266 length:1131 start_codon:yes stop_codon:yes gene_type:complete
MDKFTSKENINLLLLGSKNMLNTKLNINNINEKELYNLINNIINSIKNKFINNNYELKQLNSICLSNIKIHYKNKIENNENIKQNNNERNNNENKEENDNDNETKIDIDLLDLKVQELEKKRNYEPEYDNKILNFDNNKEEDENDNKKKTNTIINYNNTLINIDYKSFIINSINRNWFNNNYINNFNYNLNDFNIKNFKFKPQSISLPNHVSYLSPTINIKINDKYTYNFVCVFKNTLWDNWKTEDTNYFELNSNIINIKLLDLNNNLLDIGDDKISIEKVLCTNDKNLKIYKIWSKKDYIYNYKNVFNINNTIFIRTNKGIIYKKKIINIFNDDNNYNIIEIYDDNNELNINDFENSYYINLKNQFSFIIKYYTK